jgi:hypothetical protein
MSNSTFTVGGPVESRCTKCRKITNHIIVALEEEVPAKVKCNTCEGEHKYRPPAAAKKKAPKKTAAKKATTPKVTGQKEWQELREQIEGAKAADYSMDSPFKVKTVMKHPVFGLGLVEKVVGPRKIEVLFEDGRKIMRCL